MKVLWLVNIIMPEACECFDIVSSNTGGWLVGAYKGIIDKIDELVVVTTYNESTVRHCQIGKTRYYLVPQEGAKEHFSDILKSVDCDVLHIFGTELAHYKAMTAVCDLSRTIVSIQGLTSVYVNHFLDGIPIELCKKSFLRSKICQWLHMERPVYDLYMEFKQLSTYEASSVNYVKYFAGRTRFDKAFVNQNAPNAQYFKINETLRDSFYENNNWSIEKCDKNTIFIPQAHYPIKGLHVFLRSLILIKNRFPDIRVYVAGPGFNFSKRTGLRKVKDSLSLGYFNYCKSIINEYQLHDCIFFTGVLNEAQMAKQMLKANVFVLPSLIENSPNSLGEAMILGVPCVASYVGGIPDMLRDGDEGILVHSTDAHMLADAVVRILENQELAMRFSDKAKQKAKMMFNREQNADDLLSAYNYIQDKNTEKKINETKR